MNHKAASREQNIKLDTTSEESDDEMINTLNKSQKGDLLQTNCLTKMKKKIILNAYPKSFFIAKEISVKKFMAQL